MFQHLSDKEFFDLLKSLEDDGFDRVEVDPVRVIKLFLISVAVVLIAIATTLIIGG